MRIFRLFVPVLILALTVPVAGAVAGNDGSTTATIAAKKKKKKKKKKLTWCEKKVQTFTKVDKRKKIKSSYKRVSNLKSAKFSLYTKRYPRFYKIPTEYLACSESHRFTAMITAWSGIEKTSHVRAVRNNCAVFFSKSKNSKDPDDGWSRVEQISYRYFRKGSKLPPQTHADVLGRRNEKVVIGKLLLSSNCVLATTYTVNGTPKIVITGLGDFPERGYWERDLPGASAADLKSLKVTVQSKTSTLISWTVNGSAQSLVYTPGMSYR